MAAAPQDRLRTLDLIRGVAVLGILAVNIASFAAAPSAAYSPDLPGCIATGKTREEVAHNMHEAIEMHIQGMIEDQLPVPKSQATAEFVAIF